MTVSTIHVWCDVIMICVTMAIIDAIAAYLVNQ